MNGSMAAADTSGIKVRHDTIYASVVISTRDGRPLATLIKCLTYFFVYVMSNNNTPFLVFRSAFILQTAPDILSPILCHAYVSPGLVVVTLPEEARSPAAWRRGGTSYPATRSTSLFVHSNSAPSSHGSAMARWGRSDFILTQKYRDEFIFHFTHAVSHVVFLAFDESADWLMNGPLTPCLAPSPCSADCGLITRSVRADFDQLELRRRRRSPLDRSHAAAPRPDRSHASAPATEDPFAIFDSQFYPDEEEDPDYVPYTEAPPPAGSEEVAFTEPPPTTGGAEETVPTGGGKFLTVKILPHDPDAASLVYGDAEEGYEPEYYDLPPSEFAETFVIRTGKALKGDDPFGINSQEYREKISKQLKDAHFITAGQNAIVGQWPWIVSTRRSFGGKANAHQQNLFTPSHLF